MSHERVLGTGADEAKKGCGGLLRTLWSAAVSVNETREIIRQKVSQITYGGPHAERVALASCGKPEGALMYITLDPAVIRKDAALHGGNHRKRNLGRRRWRS